jgi:predicted DNA-binding protein
MSRPSNKSNETKVLTVRIEKELDDILNSMSNNTSFTKAAIIRNYLTLAKFIRIQDTSEFKLKSLNNNDMIILKSSFFSKILEDHNQRKQIDYGTLLARFINDLARIEGREEDLEYQLDLCEKFGLFPKFIDKENYILFSKFAPKKFLEAFVWQLVTKGRKGEFNKEFIDKEIEESKKTKSSYQEKIQPVKRDASHYAFEFAKLEKENK